MSRQAKPIRSDIAWSTTDRITVRGRDLPGQIIGHMNLGEFAFSQLTGREPTPQQSVLLGTSWSNTNAQSRVKSGFVSTTRRLRIFGQHKPGSGVHHVVVRSDCV
jgi:hypothetical protein